MSNIPTFPNYNVYSGDTIEEVVHGMLDKAKETGEFQRVIFNGADLIVSPNDTRTPENLIRKIHEKLKKIC